MGAISRQAAMFALAALMTCASAGAEPTTALTVRLYNGSAVSAPDLLAARRAIELAFDGSGLNLIVRHCGRASKGSLDSCSESLKPSEMVVRIIDAPVLNQTV